MHPKRTRVSVLRRLVRNGEINISLRSENELTFTSTSWLPNGETFAEIVSKLSEGGKLTIAITPQPATDESTSGNKALDRLTENQLSHIETREAVSLAQVRTLGVGLRLLVIKDVKLTISSTQFGLSVSEVVDAGLLLITPDGSVLIGRLQEASSCDDMPAAETLPS